MGGRTLRIFLVLAIALVIRVIPQDKRVFVSVAAVQVSRRMVNSSIGRGPVNEGYPSNTSQTGIVSGETWIGRYARRTDRPLATRGGEYVSVCTRPGWGQ